MTKNDVWITADVHELCTVNDYNGPICFIRDNAGNLLLDVHDADDDTPDDPDDGWRIPPYEVKHITRVEGFPIAVIATDRAVWFVHEDDVPGEAD